MDTEKLQERLCEMLALHFEIDELNTLSQLSQSDWQEIISGAIDTLQDGDLPDAFGTHQVHDIG